MENKKRNFLERLKLSEKEYYGNKSYLTKRPKVLYNLYGDMSPSQMLLVNSGLAVVAGGGGALLAMKMKYK